MQAEERKWGSYVDIKISAPELVERKLARLKRPSTIFMSTATDPYQPVEERYRITRRILEVFERYPQHGLSILTKQSLVERDADILSRLPRVKVGMSISVMDDRLAELIEPWAPDTSNRLATIKRLSDRGIRTYLLWAPAIVPVPLSKEFMSKSIGRIFDSGALSLSLDALNYRSRQSAGLIGRLGREQHAPATAAQVEILRREAYARGLGCDLDLLDLPFEEMEPMLPFEGQANQ
jgi:DNA repair photolyase